MSPSQGPESVYRAQEVLYKDYFADTKSWVAELEQGGTVTVREGRLILDVPAGCTVWFRHELAGPIQIEYEATVIGRGGPNDRVSDLNCFWMAQDPKRTGYLLDISRSGKFADYDALTAYYVGLGGNANTTTRFRRYIGVAGNRPLLPKHDLSGSENLLRANIRQHLRLIAYGETIQFWRDRQCLFQHHDPQPYTRGWMGLRTVTSHIEIEKFRVIRLGLGMNADH